LHKGKINVFHERHHRLGGAALILCPCVTFWCCMWMRLNLILLLFSVSCTACSIAAGHPPVVSIPLEPPIILYEVVNIWPHDPNAFTQGLVFEDGYLYESTGFYCESSLLRVDLSTGIVLKSVAIPEQYFAEGITILNGKIYQLTWQEGQGFIYDQASLEKISEFSYTGEGWGITDDGRDLIVSNGTEFIQFLDPDTFQVMKKIQVLDSGAPVTNLNELEYIRGEIYAIVWTTDRIARIDPQTGTVIGWIDLGGLFPISARPHEEADLNGIAYDKEQNRIFVTGKFWPWLFEIKLKD